MIALALPAAYLLIGAAWLVMKTEGELQRKAVGKFLSVFTEPSRRPAATGFVGHIPRCSSGLGCPFDERESVLGRDASGAGGCSIRIAGFVTVGMAGGNIDGSGTRALCHWCCEGFDEVLALVDR